MKHKVCELEGALLDAAVAKAEGGSICADGDYLVVKVDVADGSTWHPSTDWRDGGPIIERERIKLEWIVEVEENLWSARHTAMVDGFYGQMGEPWYGPTPLIAAMRAYASSKFGNEVDLP